MASRRSNTGALSPSSASTVSSTSPPLVPSASSSTATFASLGLSPWLVSACSLLGLHRPTPIQVQSIPSILRRQNLVAEAKTGAGKTAAFALPLLHALSLDPYGVYGLVLTPTRELAFQLTEQIKALGAPVGVAVVTCVGGVDMLPQSSLIQGRPHVIVATPGRLADHLRSGTRPHFDYLSYLVLDECDRLLEDGFKDDLDCILEALPPLSEVQVLCFSATMVEAEEVGEERWRRLELHKAVQVRIANDEASAGPSVGPALPLPPSDRQGGVPRAPPHSTTTTGPVHHRLHRHVHRAVPCCTTSCPRSALHCPSLLCTPTCPSPTACLPCRCSAPLTVPFCWPPTWLREASICPTSASSSTTTCPALPPTTSTEWDERRGSGQGGHEPRTGQPIRRGGGQGHRGRGRTADAGAGGSGRKGGAGGAEGGQRGQEDGAAEDGGAGREQREEGGRRPERRGNRTGKTGGNRDKRDGNDPADAQAHTITKSVVLPTRAPAEDDRGKRKKTETRQSIGPLP